MKRPLTGALVMAFGLGAFGARGQTPPPAAAAAASAAKPPAAAEKPVCKSQEVTGSRFPKRVCMTQAEWDAQASYNKAVIQDQARQIGH